MKKKLLLTSIMSIVMCLSLIAGATFALFTSESKVNIAVTSGNVDVYATVSDVQYKTLNKAWADATDNKTTFDGINGSAEVGADGNVTLNNIVPGDGLKFNVVVNNNSDVNTKYRVIVKNDEAKDTGLFEGLTVKVNDETFTGEATGKWTTLDAGVKENVEKVPVEIELVNVTDGSNNKYQGKTCTIVVIVEAVQGNAQTFDTVKVNSADELKVALSEATAGQLIDATDVVVELNDASYFEIPAGVTIKGASLKPLYRGINYVLFTKGESNQVVFEDCTFNDGTAGRIIQLCGSEDGPTSVVYNNCTFKGQVITNFVDNTDGIAEFNICLFTKTNATPNSSYVSGMGGTHIFNNCTFNYTELSQTNMGTLNNASINVYSESDDSYATEVILNGCTLINCGQRKYGANSTLTIK